MWVGVQDYNSAIQFFSKSNELCGEHHVTWYNIGICYYYMVCTSLCAPFTTARTRIKCVFAGGF
jgi:hypothetical protein